MGYLLSVVIPTKNRYKYLKHLITMIKDFQSNDIELIIHDNTADNAEILGFLSTIDYPNVSYFHVKEHLSVSQNAEQAILKSIGKYVCFIGDDDGLYPEIIDSVKEADSKGLEAFICKCVKYNWPDYIDNGRYKISGVVLEEVTKRKDGYLNVKSELNKVINDGFGTLGLLPKVYQGVVSRQLLERLYERCGTYFPGPSPDMANAVALSILTDKVYFFNRKLIITGQCKSVGGGERLLKGNLKSISDVPHLSQEDVNSWDKNLPNLWCAETIWPDSGISAMKQLDYSYPINYTKIYARFIYRHNAYKDSIGKFPYCRLKLKAYQRLFSLYTIYEGLCCRLSFRISKGKRINKALLYRGVNTINEVINL